MDNINDIQYFVKESQFEQALVDLLPHPWLGKGSPCTTHRRRFDSELGQDSLRQQQRHQ